MHFTACTSERNRNKVCQGSIEPMFYDPTHNIHSTAHALHKKERLPQNHMACTSKQTKLMQGDEVVTCESRDLQRGLQT